MSPTLARTLAVLAVVAGAGPAQAGQSQLPVPPVQVGVEMAFGSVGGGSQTAPRVFVPRLSVNFSPRWALDITADRYRQRGAVGELDERMFLVQMRAAIVESRTGIRLSGLFGGGMDVTRYDFPPYEVTTFDGQVRRHPEESLTHRRPLIFAGVGFSRPVSRFISVHSDVRFFPFQRFGFGARATVGMSAAIGRLPPATRMVTLEAAPDRPLQIGQRAWVTMIDGRQVEGVVHSATRSSVTVAGDEGRETISISAVARIDVLHTTSAARSRWMTIGGLSGLGLGFAMTASWVASNGGEGAEAFGIWGPGLAMVGVVAGGLVGSEIDRRRSQRRTVYDASRPAASFGVTPILTRRAQGLAASIRW